MSSDLRHGWASKTGFAASNPTSPPANPSEALELMANNVVASIGRENADGLTGQIGFYDDRMVKMREGVSGSIVFEPKPSDLGAWLPRILGAAGSAGVGTTAYKTGSVLPAFDMFVLAGDGMYKYRELRVASATFEASEGSRFRCTLNVMGKKGEERVLSYTWPDLEYGRQEPWTFADSVLFLNGGTTKWNFYRFAVSVDFMLQPRMMAGSYGPTDFYSNGRRVMLGLSSPWGNGLPQHHTLRTASIESDLKLTYGSDETEKYVRFQCEKLRPPELRTPVIPGREEIRFDLELQALLPPITEDNPNPTELTITVKA